jgi:glycosyltransferase involved in cell wall biosynthesis
VRLLFVTDRLSCQGGAGHHLLQVIETARSAGHDLTLAVGSIRPGTPPPPEVKLVKARGLMSRIDTSTGLQQLDESLASADVVHVQNVMNPSALTRIRDGGRVVVTVQDHRLFCPGPGRTLPDRTPCARTMADDACAECLPDAGYRQRLLALSEARRRALEGARVVVLSRYMAKELAAVGFDDVRVIPPWVEIGGDQARPGRHFLVGGRLVRHKAPDEARQAWQLAATGLPLVVAGTGPLEERLRGTVRLGWLDATDLYRALHDARALIFAGRWQEPFGILGVEALAAATPVVVAAGGGTRDWSDAGCLRVAAGDVVAMAAQLARLAVDPESARRLGLEGRAMVAERFARDRISARLHAVWTAAAEDR